MSLILTILNRLQIYDCQIGVVKCFAVYLVTKLQSHKVAKCKGLYLLGFQLFSISKPICFKSFQKSGNDFDTTSASLIIISVFKAKGANAIAIL